MKKLLTLTLALMGLAAMTSFAAEDATKFPGWNCTDAAKFASCAAAQPDTPSGRQIRQNCTILAKMIADKVTTFEEFCKVVDSLYPQTGNGVDAKTAASHYTIARHAKSTFPYLMGRWMPEGYAYTKVHYPSYLYVYQYKAGPGKAINITNEQLYADLTAVAKTLKKTQHKQAAILLKRILDLSTDISDLTVKKDLQTLNRLYTRHFLADEANWNAIVSEIRANLEAYK